MRPAWAFIALLALSGSPARADRAVTFPLAVDYALLADAARTSLGVAPGKDAVLWGTREGCHSLVVDEVRMSRATQRVRTTLHGRARVGLSFLGMCLFPVRWEGYVDAVGRPEIGADWRLRLRDIDSKLLDHARHETTVSSRVWDLVRDGIEPRLAAFTFDLGPPVREASALVRASVTPERAAPVVAALATMRPGAVHVDDEGVKVDAIVVVPDAPPPAPPEPALTEAELQALQERLERWDAFLIFVTKDLGLLQADQSVRDDLFALVLSNRHALLRVLAEGPTQEGDPVRALFVDAWEQLRKIVRRAASNGGLRDHALRYATFLVAGDTLAALDAAGPGLGIEISADGLRRLARVLVPDETSDPLVYNDNTDPTLRSLFGFHEPESAPTPTTPAPAPEPESWYRLFSPRAACAADPPPGDLTAVARRLDRWVPPDPELATYRQLVGKLLDHVATREGTDVDPRFKRLYHDVVHAVAWQESCWRQFVERNGKVTYLVSPQGDIGIMQVNRRVWRGFFDLEKLRWDIVYNAGAGAEILARLLSRYGTREAGTKLENAARATYSAYNAGPDGYRRYRIAKTPRAQRLIDQAFWEKFETMTAGRADANVLCL